MQFRFIKRAVVPWQVLLAGLLLAAPGQPRAAILYSTLGPGGSYNCCLGWTVSGAGSSQGYYAEGMQFTPAMTARLTQIDLALFVFNSPYVSRPVEDSIRVGLNADNGGRPGALLESYVVLNLPFGPAQLVSVASTVGTALVAGTPYWITAIPLTDTTQGGWNVSQPTAMGLSTFSNDPNFVTGLVGMFPSGQGAFQVSGNAIPEPAALALLGLGLLGFAAARSQPRS